MVALIQRHICVVVHRIDKWCQMNGGCKCLDSYYMDPSNVSCVSKELCEHKSNPGAWDDSTHICTCPVGSVIKSGLCEKCPDGTVADTEKEVCV